MTRTDGENLAVAADVNQGWKKVAIVPLVALPELQMMRSAADSREASSSGWPWEEVRNAELLLQPGYEGSRILAAGVAPRHRFEHVQAALAQLTPAYPLMRLAKFRGQTTLRQAGPRPHPDEFGTHTRVVGRVESGNAAAHEKTKRKRIAFLSATIYVALTKKPQLFNLRGMIVRCLAPRLLTVVYALGCTFLLMGCKPAPAPSTGQASPPEDRSSQNQASSAAPRQPAIGDLTNYVRSTLNPLIRLAALRADPPMRAPNALQGSDAWLFNVKITIASNEDLFDPCPADAEDARALAALIQEFNGLVAWRNAYVQSAYAKVYPGFEIKPPVATVPQLLVLRQAKERPLAPVYAKVAAEWQVDHWYFSPVDWNFPQIGTPRSAFDAPTMVQGSPEAASFFQAEREAVAQAKTKKNAIESRYADELARTVKPGTTYRGQISHPRGILPCEVRFLDTPGADPQMAMFEISLPQTPGYQLVYTAKLAVQIPLNIPNDTAANDPFHIPTDPIFASSTVPVGNLTVSFARSTGKAPPTGSLPAVLRLGADTLHNQPFLLLDGHLKGTVGGFNGDFALNAQQTP